MELVEPIREPETILKMRKYLIKRSQRDHCLFVLGISSGLRVSDLIALRCRDVMETRTRAKKRIRLREQKTGKGKDFPLNDGAVKAIEAYMATRKGWDEEAYLFESRKAHGHIQRAQAYRILTDAAQHVGITDSIGTHTLRKTFGYQSYKKTGDITPIQKLLNHSSPAITLAYIGITRDMLDNLYMSMDDVLGGDIDVDELE